MPKEFDLTFEVTLPDGNPYAGTYSLRLGSCTGLDDLDVRKETGYSLVGLMNQAQEDPGLAIVLTAVAVWLERRKTIRHTTFQDVARSITWGSDFQFDLSDGTEGKATSTAMTSSTDPTETSSGTESESPATSLTSPTSTE